MSRRKGLSGSEHDRARRERYLAGKRRLCALRLPDGRRADEVAGCPWPEQLRRAERGETVVVKGWEVGIPDWLTYQMDADGRLIGGAT